MYDIYSMFESVPVIVGAVGLVSVFFTLVSIYPVLTLFSKNRKNFKKEAYYFINEYGFKKPLVILACLVCTFVLIFTENQLVWLMDGKENLHMAPEGIHFYSVIINREDSSSRYTLPAKISKIEGLYYVENVYFSNGGYLYFNSYEYADFDETITDADQNGEFWEIKITNFKASPPNNMADYYELSFWRLLLSIVPSALMIIYTLLLLFTKNPKYSEENIELQKKYYELLNEKTKAKLTLNDTLNNYELTEQQEREFISLYNSCIERIDSKINDIKKDLIQ